MVNMEFANLESVSIKIDYGLTESATEKDTGNKFLRITDIRHGRINWDDVPFCECSESDAKKYQLREGDIVFARTGSVGNTGLIRNDVPKGSVFASYLIRIRPNKEVIDPEFLSYYFQTPDYWQQIDVGATGAIQGGLNATKLSDLKIPLPPLDEQKRIASLLARADRLRQLRRTAHNLADSLLQSVFLEMFGDLSVNDKGWKVRTLRSISSKFSDGPFGSDLKSEHYVSEGVRVIRLQNIGVGNLIDDDKAYITEEHFAELSKHQCLPGDVIVGTLGDPNLRAIILPPSISQALNKADCVQIRVNPKICNNQFFCWLLNMPQTLQLASGMIHGQTRARINMGRLAELEVPIPPLSLQEEFARVVARVESLRARMSEAERQAQALFESLLAQSFDGGQSPKGMP